MFIFDSFETAAENPDASVSSCDDELELSVDDEEVPSSELLVEAETEAEKPPKPPPTDPPTDSEEPVDLEADVAAARSTLTPLLRIAWVADFATSERKISFPPNTTDVV